MSETVYGIEENCNPFEVDAEHVGLGNADNTSDANKPISTATQTALDDKADLVGGKVPASQLPAFVDDVLEYANLAAFPVTGTAGVLYIALDTDKVYRWATSVYVEISDNLDATEVKSLYESNSNTNAFTDADESKLDGIATGATANDTDANLKNRANHTGTQTASTISDFDTEVGNHTDVTANTTDRHTHSNKTVLDNTTASFTTADESKLDGVEANANNYTHPASHTASEISDFDTEVSNNSSVAANTAKNSYPSGDSTKVGHLTVTQAVNLDTIKSDTATNNAKVGITPTQASDITANNAKVSFPEAPNDGKQYARKSLGWEEVTGGGSWIGLFL